MSDPGSISGEVAGVPFIAFSPASGSARSPTIFVWHMHDPPRSETAMAAALPLRGVDAWRVYLGLPLSGTRLPAEGLEGFFALGYEDAVLKLYAPTVRQAVQEFPAALAELRRQLGVAQGAIAFLGASIGAFVVATLVVAGGLAVRTIAFVSPALRLAAVVGANERRFQVSYAWSDESRAIASELDFVTRAPELVTRRVPATLVVGADDDLEGIISPAEQLSDALTQGGVESSLFVIPGMAHALADEPGLEPAPQTTAAAAVDVLLTGWFNDQLG